MAKKKAVKKRARKQTVKENPLAVGDQVTATTDDELLDAEKFETGIKKGGDHLDKGDEDLKAELERNLKIAVRANRGLNKCMQEDIEFALGQQWTEEEKQQLEDQNRPAMVFNKIKPMILLVAGHFLQNSARIQVQPEGGEDETFTEVADKLLDHIDKVSKLNFKLGYQFVGGIRAGRSSVEFHMDYNEDPIFGQLKIPYLGPFKVYWDPSATEYDKSDADYAFKVIKLSKSKIKQLFPKKKDQIDELEDDILSLSGDLMPEVGTDGTDYGNDPTKSDLGVNEVPTADSELVGDLRQLTVAEYWKKHYVKRKFIYFVDDGSIVELETDEEVEEEIAKRKEREAARQTQEAAAQDPFAVPVDPESIEIDHIVRERTVARMQVAIQASDLMLTDGFEDSPFEPNYHGYSFFDFIAEWAPEAAKLEHQIQGLVRSLKDPQREINKSRSQYLHILNTSANSGWIGDEDALEDTKWAELEQFGASPGITIRKKKGSELQRIHPVEPSLAQQVREKAATDDMKEVSGINADLLSVDTNQSPSGKAIAMRIRQAVTILTPAFTNFRYTKQMIGNFIFKIIPTMFDAAKIEKVLGQKFMQDNELDRAKIKAYLTIIKDGKYDVQISERGSAETLRSETFEDLMTMVEKGMPIPPDVIMEYMNMPNKQSVIKKITEYQQQQAQLAQQQEAAKAASKGR